MPIPLQKVHSQSLSDPIVLGQQNAQLTTVVTQQVAGHQWRSTWLASGSSESDVDGFQQLGLSNGLCQVGSDSQLPTAGPVPSLPGGCQHHNHCSCELRIFF